MALVLFFATMVVAGREIARRVWAGQPGAGPCERAASTAVFALAVAVALSWALAIPRLLTRGGLVVGAAVVLASAAVAWWKGVREARPGRASDGDVFGRVVAIAGVLALAVGCAFFLWRSVLVLQPNHDGAAYHLPKAAMLVRAHGYATFDGPDVRVTSWPCDYELLLADVLLLDRGDVHGTWLSVAFWGFFLVAVAGVAERWWGRGRHVLAVVLLAAAMPIVALHADVYKNDLLTCTLFLTSIAFGARWAASRERAPLLVALTSLVLALGTKGTSLFLVAALAPLAVWGWVRGWRAGPRPTPREMASWCACALGLFLALGGYVYVRNTIETGHPFGAYGAYARSKTTYGDWSNIFQFTYLAFARPFTANDMKVWVPWRHAYWFWARDDLFFSEWGMPSTLLLALLPFGLARYARRTHPGAATVPERAAASLVALLAFVLLLPLHIVPLGFFASFVRYTFFLPVFIALWTVAPALAELGRGGRSARAVAAGGMATAVVVFAVSMVGEAQRDYIEPLDYVLALAKHPEDRRTLRLLEVRAGDVADRHYAGPEDTIAFDGGFDAWSYACFGPDLRRSVIFLHPERGVPVAIPDEAKWVVIDRAYTITFGHPAFHDFGDWDDYLMRGSPSALDLAVFEQLSKDPRFKLVYRQEPTNQAIFQRVSP